MKKLIYLVLLSFVGVIQGYSQADLIVEDEAHVRKFANVGGTLFAKLNEELTIKSTSGDNLTEVQLSVDSASLLATFSTFDSGIQFGSVESDVTFRTQNTTHTRLKGDGKWGIGTDFPSARLHIFDPGTEGVNNPVLLLESVVSQRPLLLFSENSESNPFGMSIYMNGTPTQNRIHVRNTSDNDILTFSNLERFGIGVVGDPKDKLEVNGNIQVNNGEALTFKEGSITKSSLNILGTGLLIQNLETNGDILLESIQNDVIIKANGDDVIVDSGDDTAFRINGENKMWLNQNGRLGINTTGPDAMVHVKQILDEVGLRIQDNSNSDNFAFDIGQNVLFLKFNDNNIGTFNNNSGEYMATSDRRLKKTILLHDNVLEKLLKLEASTYSYIANESKERSIGFIAQEVKELFPTVVNTNTNDQGEDYYSISYDLINVLVIKAIQEQNEQKEILLQQWNELQGLEAELEETNALLSSLSKELSRQELLR